MTELAWICERCAPPDMPNQQRHGFCARGTCQICNTYGVRVVWQERVEGSQPSARPHVAPLADPPLPPKKPTQLEMF